VSDILGEGELYEDIEIVAELSKALRDAHGKAKKPREIEGIVPDVFTMAYPAYLEAMSKDPNYYLSDVELVALCRCDKRNIAVFQQSVPAGHLCFLRAAIVDENEPVTLTSLCSGGGPNRLRTHFEAVQVTEVTAIVNRVMLPLTEHHELDVAENGKGESMEGIEPNVDVQPPWQSSRKRPLANMQEIQDVGRRQARGSRHPKQPTISIKEELFSILCV